MDDLIEILVELIFELGVETSKNKKIPKYIRYPLIALILLLSIGVIGLIILIGTVILKDSLIGGILIILLGIVMAILGVMKFRKVYLKKSTLELNGVSNEK